LIAGYLLLGHVDRTRPRHLLSVLRDWLPLGLIVLAYREMGWFAPAEHSYELERSWIVWDRLLLGDWGLKAAIEFFGPLVPSILEISYALVYAIGPFSVAVLYRYGRRAEVNRFLFPFLLGTVASYCLFPYFPSEPPRAAFPGEDAALHNVFRQFNWWLLGGHGIHTSVFPSAHVSSAFAAAFAMLRVMPDRKWPGGFLMVLASLIFVATVYGRYHYLVDGLAGIERRSYLTRFAAQTVSMLSKAGDPLLGHVWVSTRTFVSMTRGSAVDSSASPFLTKRPEDDFSTPTSRAPSHHDRHSTPSSP
jgi:membrane-associated phospholipid phosphatase